MKKSTMLALSHLMAWQAGIAMVCLVAVPGNFIYDSIWFVGTVLVAFVFAVEAVNPEPEPKP